jgi:GDP-4-dehydro-6-deoxy-D-mannose reductase
VSAARILITGVGGFVGAHLARAIVDRGNAALGLGIDPAPAATARFLTHEWRADVRDVAALRAAFGEADPAAIVHLAGQSSAGQSFALPLETFQANVLGTADVLEAAQVAAPRARVLVVGTGEIYGSRPAGTRVAEDAPFHPVSPYALSKAVADAIAGSYSRRGLDVVRTRSFGHIGPGQTDRFVVPSLARQIAEIEAGRSEAVVRVGNLDVTRDLTDVRDVVEAYLALLERGRSGAVYNVCRGAGTPLADVARTLCERARVPISLEVDAARIRPADIPYLVGDPSAIEGEVGWKAAIPLERTLDEVLEEWRRHRAMGAVS